MRKLIFFILFIICGLATNAQRKDILDRFWKSKNAVAIPDSARWYNTYGSINTYEPKGKIILLHFWDPNAQDHQRVLQEVVEIDKKHRSVLLFSVLKSGIPQSKTDESVEQTLRHYGVLHPVAVFEDFESLKPFELQSWGDYCVLLDNGRLFKTQYVGDPIRDVSQSVDSLATGSKEGLNQQYSEFEGTGKKSTIKSVLDQPTLIEIDAKEQRLFVVDASKNQILVLDMDGRIIETIGNGVKGDKTGKFQICRFNRISGIAYDENTEVLYISDAGNHQVKKAEMQTGRVSAILGSGSPSLIAPKEVQGTGGAIDSPGQLQIVDQEMWIAMDGDHALYQMNLITGKALKIAGNGSRVMSNGAPNDAGFASMNDLILMPDSNIGIFDQSNQVLQVWDRESELIKESEFIAKAKEKNPNTFITALHNHKGQLWYFDTDASVLNVVDDGNVVAKLGSGTGEQGIRDGKKTKARWMQVSDMASFRDDIYVLDEQAGLMKLVQTKKQKSKTVQVYDYRNIFMYNDPYGEKNFKYQDEVKLNYTGNPVVTVDIQLPDGYKWDRSGKNAAVMVEAKGSRLLTTDPTTGYIEMEIAPDEQFPNVKIQLFMSAKDENEKVKFQSVVLTIPFDFQTNGPDDVETDFEAFTDR